MVFPLSTKHLLRGLLIGVSMTFLGSSLVGFLHTYTHTPIVKTVEAVAGTLSISGTDTSITGDITAARLLDQANTSYFIDPAASGNSLITAGAASVSGSLVLNAAATIQTTNMQPLTIGSSTTGGTTVTSGGNLQLQAGGTGTGSTGTGSIYFLDSAGATTSRFDTTGNVNATGGTITTSGLYRIHTFTSSGTFTPANAGNVEYLVVGGGGGGGDGTPATSYGGGGGAGGYKAASGYAVTATGYTVTVGAAGTAAPDGGATAGGDGGNSVFGSITSTGGGGGGSTAGAGSIKDGRNGGSGGGVAWGGTTAGTGIAGQGFAGSTYNSAGASGGGGGSAATSTTGAGGIGTANSISGSSVTYATGGGGGPDGASTANSGNGGNSENTSRNGQAGGSGIVIVRYLPYGTLYLGATNTSSADLAEYYVSGDKTIEAGDVVTISQKSKIKNQNDEEVDTKGVLMKADTPYDSKLIGIISTNPGVLMGSIDGENKEDKRMLALAGKVPVKIDPDSEPIGVGDFLTSSTKPGLAMKATHPGYVVARALEDWKPGGPGTIDAFLQLTYSMGDIDPYGNFRTLEVDSLKTKTLEVGGVNIMDRLTKLEEEIRDLKRRLER